MLDSLSVGQLIRPLDSSLLKVDVVDESSHVGSRVVAGLRATGDSASEKVMVVEKSVSVDLGQRNVEDADDSLRGKGHSGVDHGGGDLDLLSLGLAQRSPFGVANGVSGAS